MQVKQWTLGRHQFQEITSYSKPHTEMHARLLVTSHGRNRQHMQFELAATTRKKQWMCFSHINGHEPTRRDVQTNGIGSGTIQKFTKTHALAASLRVKYLLNIFALIEELLGA